MPPKDWNYNLRYHSEAARMKLFLHVSGRFVIGNCELKELKKGQEAIDYRAVVPNQGGRAPQGRIDEGSGEEWKSN